MKNLAFLIVLFVLPYVISAQTSTSDCEGAIVLCGDLYTEDSAPPGTGNVYEYTGACNANLETMSLWYTFTVSQDGDLSFILTPNTDTDDYDWGLFDITNGGCAGIAVNGASPEVNCNSYGSLTVPNGPTGMSTAQGGTGTTNGPGDTNGPPFNADLPVVTGQTFALVVMNWSNSTSGYSIDFAGSSATIFDDVNPTIVDVTVNCDNSEFHINFSEPIVNNTVANLDFQIEGPQGVIFFNDVTPDNTTGDMSAGFTLSPSVDITAPGEYIFSVNDSQNFVEDACGNQAIAATFTFNLFAPITWSAASTTACNGIGGTIQLSELAGGEEPYLYQLNGTTESEFLVSNLSDGNYTMSITDQRGCIETQTIIVPNNPIVVQAIGQDTLSCSKPTIDVEGVEVIPQQNVTYDWNYLQDGEYVSTSFSTATPTIGSAGIYEIIVTNPDNGCTNSTLLEIYSEEIGKLDLSTMRFPNIITPNNDSKNEYWGPYLVGNDSYELVSLFSEYELKIYDRWGRLVFESKDGNSRLWAAKDAAEGTYYYLLDYKVTCGGVQEGKHQGTITVVR
jgi:gliding motility-associated-like protein